MFFRTKMFLELFCAEICHKRIWFIVLFFFAAFESIKTQKAMKRYYYFHLDKEQGYHSLQNKQVQRRAASACLTWSSRSLAVLSDRITTLKFKTWFFKHERYLNKGCMLKFLN